MAKNPQSAELPKARKLPTERLVIDESKISLTYQTESDEPPQLVELLAVNSETGDEVRVPMNTNSKALAASGHTATRWRNTSRTTAEVIAGEIGQGQWRCYLLIDSHTLYRPSPAEGLLEEPAFVSSDFSDLKFHRSHIGLLVIDIQRRKLVPVQDLIVTAERIWHEADHTLRIAGTVELFGKPLSGSLCELEIRAREGAKALQRVSFTPIDGRFEAAFPASELPFGIHDVGLNLPSSDSFVRIRYPEGLDDEGNASVSSDEASGTVATAYRTKTNYLALYVTPAPAHFEINRIQATQTTFMIAGAVEGTSEGDRTARKVLNRYQCFAVGRDTGDEIELGVTFDEGTFHIKFAPQKLDDIDFGIWDIAMKSPRGELCYLARGRSAASGAPVDVPVVSSSVAGAAAAIELLGTTSDRISINVSPILKGSRLERLSVGNAVHAIFELETRNVPIATLFSGCKTTLLVAFGTKPAHRMPAHARFTPTGTFTCKLELDCGLAGATAERLRKIIGNCALGIEFKGPNVDGTAPLDTDGARIFARGLRALLEAEWTETVSAKRGEAIYDRAKQRPAWPDVALFQNDDGESCSGNARAISQELTRRAPQIKQIWALRDPEQLVPNAHMNIRPGSSAYYKHLARARFIIGDADLPDFVEKRPGALHLQTALPRADDGPQLTAQTLSRWDIVLSPHTFATKRLRQALHFTGEILEHGNPRNDILRDVTARETIANRVRSELGIHARRKIVLYVPERGDVRPPVSFHTLKRALGDDHTFLLRLPRDVTNSLEWLAGYGGFAVDVSHYGALSDLLCAADVFVTDTSPAIVDFALTGRPIVFYLRDTEILDPAFIEQAPGPIVRRQTGLIRALQRIDDISEKFAPQYRAFVETYCSAEQGNAAATAVSRLLERSRL